MDRKEAAIVPDLKKEKETEMASITYSLFLECTGGYAKATVYSDITNGGYVVWVLPNNEADSANGEQLHHFTEKDVAVMAAAIMCEKAVLEEKEESLA